MLISQNNPHGGDWASHPDALDFSANINPYGPPEAVRRALRNSPETVSLYPDPACRALRHALSEKTGLPADSILCGNGAAELIYSFAACLPARKKALLLEPAFSEYEAALYAFGKKADHLILSPENCFLPDEMLFAQPLSSYSAVFVCSPSNPAGVMLSEALLERLAASGPLVFCDLSFLALSDMPDAYDIPAFLTRFPKLIFLFSFTKSYAIPGIRLGWCASSHAALLRKMSEKAPCWNVSSAAQAAGLAALSCGAWLRDSAALLHAERRRTEEALKGLGLTVFPGRANFLLVKGPAGLSEKLAEKNIIVRNCANYRGLSEEYFRLAIRLPEDNERLLAAVKECIS